MVGTKETLDKVLNGPINTLWQQSISNKFNGIKGSEIQFNSFTKMIIRNTPKLPMQALCVIIVHSNWEPIVSKWLYVAINFLIVMMQV